MIRSIRLNGIIQPIVVRPIENGKYEILSGHNRKYCGKEECPMHKWEENE